MTLGKQIEDVPRGQPRSRRSFPFSGLRRFRQPSSVVAGIPEGTPADESIRRDSLYRRLLGLADATAAAIALAVAIPLAGNDGLTPVAALGPLGVVLVSKIVGLYDRDQHLLLKTTLDETPAVFQVATLFTLLTWLSGPLVVEGTLGHPQVLALWGLLTVLMVIARAVARPLARRHVPVERCLVVGDAGISDRLKEKFVAGSGPKAELVARVSVRPNDDRRSRVPTVGTLEELGLVCEEREIHRVIIAPRSLDSNDVLETIRLVKSLGVKVSVLPRLFEVVGAAVELDYVHGMTLLGVRHQGLTASSAALKRGFDLLVGGSLALILLPLCCLVALAIKLDSPGPVLFRQGRIGRNGKAFDLFKFRSMVRGAEEQKQWLLEQNETDEFFKMRDDPRITRVGRVLRRTSLDELPQLINVLRGEMTLVGPRPLVLDEDSRIDGWERTRSSLTPGMTGPWQVLGSSRIPMDEMIKIDYLYATNWSLWQDVKILLRTAPHVLRLRGL